MSGSVERDGEIFRGEVAQMKKNDGVLDCLWFWFRGFLAGLFHGGSGRDGSRIQGFSGGGRKMLRGREPLIQLGISRKTSPEYFSLEFGKFELLIGNRVTGTERSLGERDLIVLPREIPKGQKAVGCEVRVAGVPFDRRNRSGVGLQTEFNRRHPCERAGVHEFGINEAEKKAAIVASVKKRVIHLERSVADRKIKRDSLVVPEKLAAAKLETVDGKRKKLFDWSLAANCAGFSRRKVGGSVRIESHVDDWLLENDFPEGEFGTQKKIKLQAGNDAVHVSERDIGGRLASVDSDPTHFSLQAKRNGVDAGNFGAATGDAFHFGDEAAANQRLERLGVDVDHQAENYGESGCKNHQQIFPPASASRLGGRFSGRFSHRD